MPRKKGTLFRNHSTFRIYSALTFDSNFPIEMKKTLQDPLEIMFKA